MLSIARILLLILISLTGICRGAENFTWGTQAVASKVLGANEPTFYGNWGDMVLLRDRYPCIVYMDHRSGHQLRCAEWTGGTRRDEVIATVDYDTTAVRIAAHGDVLLVSWKVSGTIWLSMRVDHVWTTPEVLHNGGSPGWALGVKPDGTPVAAVYTSSSFGPSPVMWKERTAAGAWSSTTITQISTSISTIMLSHDHTGNPTVAWRSFGNSGSQTKIEYAMRGESGWSQPTVVPEIVLLSALYSGPSGDPRLIGRTAGYASRLHHLAPGNPGTAEAIPLGLPEILPVTILPDGTLHAVSYDRLITRKDGVWSESRCPISHAILADASGTLHFLGADREVLSYSTMLPGDPPPFHKLETYEDGGSYLEDLAMHPDGNPRLFAWKFDDATTTQYAGAGATWTPSPVNNLGPGWLYAFDSTGRRHAMTASGYAVEDAFGVMKTETFPVTINTFSSGSIVDFVVDAAGHPHAGFYSGVGTSSVTVHYGVKRSDEWTVETVSPGEVYDQQCALALHPGGSPWMFTSRGLFRRSNSGWVHEYVTTRARFPGIGISSDGTVHAIFVLNEQLVSLTGKDGSYTTEVLANHRLLEGQTAFAMAGDRPLMVHWRELSYSPTRHALVLMEKIGGAWRQRFITSPSAIMRTANTLRLVTTADGRWTIAGRVLEIQGSYARGLRFVCQGQLDERIPAASDFIQTSLPDGSRRFQIHLGNAPYKQPLLLQGSATLDAWRPLILLGPELRAHDGVQGISMRGDPFRTHVTYDVPADQPSWFIRLIGE